MSAGAEVEAPGCSTERLYPHLPTRVFSLQELLQAKQDLQHLLIAKEEQEDLLRKRERELTALKGALKEEVSSHDREMDKLKEQYDAELLALRESVEEATKVGPGQRGKQGTEEAQDHLAQTCVRCWPFFSGQSETQFHPIIDPEDEK